MAKQLEFSLKILGTDTQVKSIESIRASLLKLNAQLQGVSASSVSFDVITVKIDALSTRLAALEAAASASVNAISGTSARQKAGADGLISSITGVGKAFEETLGSVRTAFSEIEGETITLEQGFKKWIEAMEEQEDEFQKQKSEMAKEAAQQRLDILLLEQKALMALQASQGKLSDQDTKKLKELEGGGQGANQVEIC